METVTSPLDNLCGPGKVLHREAPGAREFEGLKMSGTVRFIAFVAGVASRILSFQFSILRCHRRHRIANYEL